MTPPRDAVERLLAEVWARLLGLDEVGVHDNFFDLGGHSLLASEVVAAVRDAFDVDLALRTLFVCPTIAELADRVRSPSVESPARRPPLRHEPGRTVYPLAPSQRTVWLVNEMIGKGVLNVDLTYRLQGPLDIDVLRRALRAIVERHAPLRTRIENRGGGPVQVVTPPEAASFALEQVDATSQPDIDQFIRELVAEVSSRPLDLAHDPLFRAWLVQQDRDDHVLFLLTHHIVFDAWSTGILMSELSELYRAFLADRPSPFDPLSVEFPDFAIWQDDWLDTARLHAQFAYWEQALAHAEPFGMARARPIPTVPTRVVGRHPIRLDQSAASRIRRQGGASDASPFMILLSAFMVCVRRWSGRQDVVIGSPVAGRPTPEVDGLIGDFASIVALRAQMHDDQTFVALVEQMRGFVLDAIAHADVPSVLPFWFPDPRSEVADPVSIVFQVIPHPGQIEVPGLRVTPFDPSGGQHELARGRAMDLHFGLLQTDNGFEGALVYSKDRFDDRTAAGLVADFERLAEALVSAPERELGEALRELRPDTVPREVRP
jgi:acyl carrier protein